MPVAWRGSGGLGGSSGSRPPDTVPFPAALVVGDLMLFIAVSEKTSTTGVFSLPTLPAGWAQLVGTRGSHPTGGSIANVFMTTWWKVAASADVAAGSMSVDWSGGGLLGPPRVGGVVAYSGVDTSSFDIYLGAVAASGGTTNTITTLDFGSPGSYSDSSKTLATAQGVTQGYILGLKSTGGGYHDYYVAVGNAHGANPTSGIGGPNSTQAPFGSVVIRANWILAGTPELSISDQGVPPLPIIIPADELGYCITTVHDFGATAVAPFEQQSIAESPSGATLYAYPHSGPSVLAIDLASFAVTTHGASLGYIFASLCTDAAGNVYVQQNTGAAVDKITPGGATTSPWAALPVGMQGFAITMGRDGNLYVRGNFGSHGLDAVCQITLGGVVTDLTSAVVTTEGFASNDGIAVASDGTIGMTLGRLSSGDPNYGVNNVVRLCVPAGGGTYTLTDVPAQSIVYSGDGITEMVGGIFCDWQDHFIVPMVTFQFGAAISTPSPDLLSADDGQFQSGLGNWIDTSGNSTLSVVSSPAHGSSKTIKIVESGAAVNNGLGWNPLFGGYPVTPGVSYVLSAWCAADAADAGLGVTTSTLDGVFDFRDSSGSVLGSVGHFSGTLVPGDPMTYLVAAAVAPAGATHITAGFNFNWSSPPAGTTWYLSDVRFGPGDFSPDLSWFLRISPAGAATRIAGTWAYTDAFPTRTSLGRNTGQQTDIQTAPPPDVTTTNVADGPLNTSLCCELDDGAGMSQDGKTLWFIDDSNQSSGVTGNLLRKLTLCATRMANMKVFPRDDDSVDPPVMVHPTPKSIQAQTNLLVSGQSYA